jgi:pyruvate,water dikinase
LSGVEAGDTYTVSLADPSARERERVGGKAASLADMIGEGLRVPPGFAVTADACRLFLAGAGAGMQSVAAVEARPVPEPVAADVRAAYAALAEQLGVADPAVAVRSSAVAEDAEAASFAGEFESYLWVSGADAVLDALRRCWASLFTERALEYQARHGVDPADNAMAVAVHLMVDARVAGVMFTLNPVTGDPSRISIEASWGLGVAVVNGEVNPDSWLVDKISLDVRDRHVGDKAFRYGPPPAPGEELAHIDVPADLRGVACLEDAEVAEIARLGLELHRAQGRPQDIEWAIDSRLEWPESLFLLQRRPETVHSQKPKKLLAGANATEWVTRKLGAANTSTKVTK